MRRLEGGISFAKPLIQWPSGSVILCQGTVSTALRSSRQERCRRDEVATASPQHTASPQAKPTSPAVSKAANIKAARLATQSTYPMLSKPTRDVCRVTATAGYHSPPLKRRSCFTPRAETARHVGAAGVSGEQTRGAENRTTRRCYRYQRYSEVGGPVAFVILERGQRARVCGSRGSELSLLLTRIMNKLRRKYKPTVLAPDGASPGAYQRGEGDDDNAAKERALQGHGWRLRVMTTN